MKALYYKQHKDDRGRSSSVKGDYVHCFRSACSWDYDPYFGDTKCDEVIVKVYVYPWHAPQYYIRYRQYYLPTTEMMDGDITFRRTTVSYLREWFPEILEQIQDTLGIKKLKGVNCYE